jgi:probable HAF family extracellular repeat protein
MKPRILVCAFCLCSIAALTIPNRVQGQLETGQLHHYKLIDLGTLGGPVGLFFGLTGPLNNRGMASTCVSTAEMDPNYPNINLYFASGPQPNFIEHAVLWQNGVLTDLGTLPGGTSSCEQWITDTGLIVGGSTNGIMDPLLGVPEVQATLWLGKKPFDLGTLGGYESVPYSANDFGQVVGGAANTIPDAYNTGGFNFAVQAATQVHAFLWERGVMRDLGTLGDGTDSVAFYVNDLGQVNGISFTNNIVNATTGLPTTDPFVWQNGKMTDLGTLGGVYAIGNYMNDRGQVAGSSDLAGDQTGHPFLWSKATGMQDLGTLGGVFGSAEWMNNTGEVIGFSTIPGDQGTDAFLWKNGVMTNISPTTDTFGEAEGINDLGQIVGGAQDSQGNGYGFLWQNGGPMVHLYDLAVPGSDLIAFQEATFINNRGEIAGNGTDPAGNDHAALMIPCDESHPGIPGCDYSSVNAKSLAETRAAQAAQPSKVPATRPKLSPAEMMARYRAKMANRRHGSISSPIE